MTSEGHALTRFRRALASYNGPAAYAAASELQRIELADALMLTLLLVGQRDLFDRLSVRWVARFAMEVRDVRTHVTQLVLASLAAVGAGSRAGAHALAELFDELHRTDLTAAVESWLERR